MMERIVLISWLHERWCLEFGFDEAKAGPGCKQSIFLSISHFSFRDSCLPIWKNQRIF